MNTPASTKHPLILEIKGNSLDDGPGIRTVVFFKGCPLSCRWCHNPESKSSDAELSHDPGECIACGACIDTCPEGAISRNNRWFIDREKCTLCGECVEACPSGALSMVGKTMSVEAVVQEIEKDIPFFETSGGGVTLSGGEPALFMEFTAGLARSLKEKRIHVLLETCGLFNYDRFTELLYPYLDVIYYDIKIMDPVEHKKQCGTDNNRILENFTLLNHRYREEGVEILPRIPLIPDITDTDTNLSAIAEFLASRNVKKAGLMEYNPLWGVKCEKIGAENPLGKEKKQQQWMERGQVERCRKIFSKAGIEV